MNRKASILTFLYLDDVKILTKVLVNFWDNSSIRKTVLESG